MIKRLLFILAESDAISNHKLNELLHATTITITNILDVLVQAELLIKVPVQGSQAAAAKKPAKYLFMSSVIRAAFYNITGSTGTTQTRGLLEDTVGLHLYRKFGLDSITYDSSLGGADFIVNSGISHIAMEIGRAGKSTGKCLVP